MKKFLCILLLTGTTYSVVHAQVELAQLLSKKDPATGLGLFLHFGFPVSKASEVTGELGFYYFSPHHDHILMAPILAGYRLNLNGKSNGFYVEPQAGYTLAGTDIQTKNDQGEPVYVNGNPVDQKASGATAAIAAGYLFPTIPLQIGLRFTHIFVSGDPAQSVLSLRMAYVLAFGRR